jgi:hypothetical protein
MVFKSFRLLDFVFQLSFYVIVSRFLACSHHVGIRIALPAFALHHNETIGDYRNQVVKSTLKTSVDSTTVASFTKTRFNDLTWKKKGLLLNVNFRLYRVVASTPCS